MGLVAYLFQNLYLSCALTIPIRFLVSNSFVITKVIDGSRQNLSDNIYEALAIIKDLICQFYNRMHSDFYAFHMFVMI